MKKFSDFGVQATTRNMFDVPQAKIYEVLNCPIEVIDFQSNVTTKIGEGRYVVLFSISGVKKKLITSASRIKEALEQIPKDGFPFSATIKQQIFADGKSTYYFTD